MIGRILRQWFTGPDNQSFELGRLLWALGVLAMIVYQGYAIYKGQPFDPISFGGGFGAILAAGGIGIAQKDKANSTNQPVTVETVQGDINTENVSVRS